MEYKNPLNELLASLEQLALPENPLTTRQPDAFAEFERLWRRSGLGERELAQMMGVSEAVMHEWVARRDKPSSTALQLMRLIDANPALSRQLIS